MEVHLSKEKTYKIVACSVVHYLLEKSRVVNQAVGERNFHIFYYILSQHSEEEQAKLFVNGRTPESFKFLSSDGSECAPAEQHDDVEECAAMRKAFEEMEIRQDEQMNFYGTVAAVLHLGDISFEDSGSTGSKVSGGSSKKGLDFAAKLLGVSSDRLEAVLTKHESMQRDGLMSRAFNPSMAADARNALARHLYSRLFDHLIRCVNVKMKQELIVKMQGDTKFIGMLDIFGFEIFDVNSFEQLSINFANEKLQQLFNRHTFLLEERTYEEEGIQFDHIEFHDSQPLLSFLGLGSDSQVRDGVFQILDEQTAVGSGTDEKFLQVVTQKHKDKKNLFSDQVKTKTAFKVFHYAGVVQYESTGFVAKNADKLYENIIELLKTQSTNPFISKELFGEDVIGNLWTLLLYPSS